jgi:hypothetical protein
MIAEANLHSAAPAGRRFRKVDMPTVPLEISDSVVVGALSPRPNGRAPKGRRRHAHAYGRPVGAEVCHDAARCRDLRQRVRTVKWCASVTAGSSSCRGFRPTNTCAFSAASGMPDSVDDPQRFLPRAAGRTSDAACQPTDARFASHARNHLLPSTGADSWACKPPRYSRFHSVRLEARGHRSP